jgi:hypothetical protein
MDILDREAAKRLLANYIRNTDDDESEVVERLSQMLADGQSLNLKEARKLVQEAINDTIEDIIVNTSYLDGSHPSLDTAIEICFKSHIDGFVENILRRLDQKKR